MEQVFGSSSSREGQRGTSGRSEVGTRREAAVLPLGGRYALGSELGRGGEASVYAATDLVLERRVAVKVFHPHALPPSEKSLEQIEMRVAASVSHSALTTLFDSGVDIGPDGTEQLYLVMEYIPGENLRARLRRGAMTPSEACWLGFDLAEGLDYLHQTGFIHRDVKPANVLISSQRSVRPVVAKLTDFGIATPVGQPDFSEFTTGTAAYLAPEQVEGHDAEPASDVYSLGLLLLEAMTGHPEFPGTVSASAFARLTRDPHIPDTVPLRTAALLRRMTTRTPSSRIGLFDAAVELQQILVDDLLARRGEALQRAPQSAPPRAVGVVTSQAQPNLETAARLIADATASPFSAIVLHTGEGSSVAASFGWTELPRGLAAHPPRGLVDDHGSWTITATSTPGHLAVPRLPDEIITLAGAPIAAADRSEFGVVYVADANPRVFTPAQLSALRDGAELIATDLQLRLAIRRVLFPDS